MSNKLTYDELQERSNEYALQMQELEYQLTNVGSQLTLTMAEVSSLRSSNGRVAKERNELAAQVERLKHDRDDALALVIRYQSLLECAIRGEEIIVGDAILIGIDAELADEIEESFDESPKAALAALKAQWHDEALKEFLEILDESIGVERCAGRNVSGDTIEMIYRAARKFKQRAQETTDD